MIIRFHRALTGAVRAIGLVLLLVGLAGLAVAGGGRLACEPGCPMHQSDMASPDCCGVESANHTQIHASSSPISQDCARSRQLADTCCETTSCFSRAAQIPGMAVFSGGPADVAAIVAILHIPAPVVSNPPDNLSLDFHQRLKTPPIYMRTCVYLI